LAQVVAFVAQEGKDGHIIGSVVLDSAGILTMETEVLLHPQATFLMPSNVHQPQHGPRVSAGDEAGAGYGLRERHPLRTSWPNWLHHSIGCSLAIASMSFVKGARLRRKQVCRRVEGDDPDGSLRSSVGTVQMDEESNSVPDVDPFVSDEEVEKFLAEMGSNAKVQRVPEGEFAVDPYENVASKGFDLFEELRAAPDRGLLYEQALQERPLTVKERLKLVAEYAEEGDWKEARYVMRGIWRKKRLRLPLGRILWNLMIKAHMRAGRPKAAESWLLDMLDRVYQPDVISYNTLLQAYANNGNYLKATEWMKRMEARGVQPDIYTYTALVNSHATASNLEGAQRTVFMMRDAGVCVDNAIPYNAVLKVCANSGYVDYAERWLAQMLEWGVSPDRVSFLHLMRASANSGNLERADYWFSCMEEQNLPPARQHFTAMLAAHARQGDDAGVQRWLSRMAEVGIQADSLSDILTWRLAAAAEHGNTSAVEQLFSEIEEAGEQPDVATAQAVLAAFAKAEDADGAKKWFLRLERMGVEMDLKCYTWLIQACVGTAEAAIAERFARRILRRGMSLNAETYNALLSVLAKAGEGFAAEFWMDHLQRSARWRRIEFPASQLRLAGASVLEAHVNSGNLEAAESCMEQMLGEGVEPNGQAYSSLVRGFLSQGDEASAQKWVARMTSWSDASIEDADLLADVNSRALLS